LCWPPRARSRWPPTNRIWWKRPRPIDAQARTTKPRTTSTQRKQRMANCSRRLIERFEPTERTDALLHVSQNCCPEEPNSHCGLRGRRLPSSPSRCSRVNSAKGVSAVLLDAPKTPETGSSAWRWPWSSRGTWPDLAVVSVLLSDSGRRAIASLLWRHADKSAVRRTRMRGEGVTAPAAAAGAATVTEAAVKLRRRA
jgi:hypothetical protein